MATKTQTKTQTKTKKRTTTKKKISAADIQVRAQEIYQNRVNTGRHGDALSDWLEAEKSLAGKN